MSIFRISRPDDGQAVAADSAGQIAGIIASGEPGRHRVYEINSGKMQAGQISRRWGVAINGDDGAIVIERDPLAGCVGTGGTRARGFTGAVYPLT